MENRDVQAVSLERELSCQSDMIEQLKAQVRFSPYQVDGISSSNVKKGIRVTSPDIIEHLVYLNTADT